MITKRKVIEIIAVVAAAGTGIILANLIKSTTPEDTKRINKAMIWVGGLFLGFMLTEKVKDYTTSEMTKLLDKGQTEETVETVEGEV